MKNMTELISWFQLEYAETSGGIHLFTLGSFNYVL